MIISHLKLQNFRSFGKKEFTLSPQTTIIIGSNAVGKTNILESLFLLAVGKSFRAEESSEMISFEEKVGRVKVTMKQFNNETMYLEIMLTRGEVMGIKTPLKKYNINGVGKSMLDFVGRLKIVLFWPQDLELVTDSPSLRRHYLDFVLMQADREYIRSLHSYEKGLRQRNRVLEAIRDTGAHHHQLLFWDQLLIKSGEYITNKREEYIDFVNKFQIANFPYRVNKFQINTKSQMPNYQLFYDASIISQDRLDQYSKEEIAAANTLVGPHRDDIKFKIKNEKLKINDEDYRNLSHFGSRGEQRLGILWLKLAELAYIESVSGDKPVLLLDDIFSELDHEHRSIIFDIIGNQQTIMTTTDEHFIENKSLKELEIIKL